MITNPSSGSATYRSTTSRNTTSRRIATSGSGPIVASGCISVVTSGSIFSSIGSSLTWLLNLAARWRCLWIPLGGSYVWSGGWSWNTIWDVVSWCEFWCSGVVSRSRRRKDSLLSNSRFTNDGFTGNCTLVPIYETSVLPIRRDS